MRLSWCKYKKADKRSVYRLIRLMAEEPSLHGFLTQAAADRELVDQVKKLIRAGILPGEHLPDKYVRICQQLGVPESVFQSRVWAMASILRLEPEMESPYTVLGIDPGADMETIKKAFRRLSLHWHPDVNQGSPESVRRFRQIKAAYDILSDPSLRNTWENLAMGLAWDQGEVTETPPVGKWKRARALWPLVFVVVVLVIVMVFMDKVVQQRRPFVPMYPSKKLALVVKPKKLAHNTSISIPHSDTTARSHPESPTKKKVRIIASKTKNKVYGTTCKISGSTKPKRHKIYKATRHVLAKKIVSGSKKDNLRQNTGSLIKPRTHEIKSASAMFKPSSVSSSDNRQTPYLTKRLAEVHDVERRLKAFIQAYTRDYQQRDLTAFLGHFDSNATENGKPLSRWQETYRKNFASIPFIYYSINPTSWSLSKEGILVKGEFHLKATFQDGRHLSSHGTITMDLIPYKDTYRVRRLSYRFLKKS